MKSFGKVKYRRYAFTLAEVLITITVIGVVAALTIPNLVNNYQNKAWSTASVVFQRKLGEALKVMNSQGTLAGYSSTEDFVNELSKHIKINKICKNDDLTSCFEDTVFWENDNEEVNIPDIKFSANLGVKGWKTNTLGLQFADGVSGIIAYNPECSQDPYRTDVITVSDTGIGTDCIALLYDTSGFKKPNTSGKDVNGINISILGASCTLETSSGSCFTKPVSYQPATLAQCQQMVSEGYPINACSYSNDYWAGAVKVCHDLGSRLPTEGELKELTAYVYSTGTRDVEKAQAMGITQASLALNTYIWSNSELSATHAGHMQVNNTWRWGTGLRSDNSHFAICMAD